jgi:hypothetical protein
LPGPSSRDTGFGQPGSGELEEIKFEILNPKFETNSNYQNPKPENVLVI